MEPRVRTLDFSSECALPWEGFCLHRADSREHPRSHIEENYEGTPHRHRRQRGHFGINDSTHAGTDKLTDGYSNVIADVIANEIVYNVTDGATDQVTNVVTDEVANSVADGVTDEVA